MRARTPKKRFLGFYNQNDVVLDLSDTKRHRFGWQQFFFLIPTHIPKRSRLGLPESKTTSFWNCFKSLIQNNVVWISDLVPNDVILA